MEAFQDMQFESEVYYKLLEAEREAEHTKIRYSSKVVLKAAKVLQSPELSTAGAITRSCCRNLIRTGERQDRTHVPPAK